MARRSGPAVAVIGAGRLARSMLARLGPAGYPVLSVASTRLATARSAVRGLRRARATTSLRRAVEPAELILLAVPDRSIRGVAEKLAAIGSVDWSSRIVLHHAGALGLAPLTALHAVGASVGLLHPLQCLGSSDRAAAVLPGSRARIEGDRRARTAASRLARALGLVPLPLRELSAADRTAYHAAASLLSNDLLALLSLGVDLLMSIGLTRRVAIEALLALSRGTLSQVEGGDLSAALTGPVARGDIATLKAHLERLAQGHAEDPEIHRLLSLRLTRLAAEQEGPHAARAIRRLLAGRESGPAV